MRIRACSWVHPERNYNDVLNGLNVLIEVSTLEGWLEVSLTDTLHRACGQPVASLWLACGCPVPSCGQPVPSCDRQLMDHKIH